MKSLGNCNKALVIRWSLCQSMTINEQLNGGVRYFDMRPGYIDYEDDFFFVHGLHGFLIRDMLMDMRHFLDDNPREVIIVDFNHFHGFDQLRHARFAQMISNIFAGILLSRDDFEVDDVSFVSLCDMRSCKRQVLLSYKEPGICSGKTDFWFSRDLIFSPWHNTNNLICLEHGLNKLVKTQDARRLNVFQAILSARKSTVLSNPSSTLRDALITKCNTGIKKWLRHRLDEHQQRRVKQYGVVNVLMCDFVCEDDLVGLILQLNDNIVVQ